MAVQNSLTELYRIAGYMTKDSDLWMSRRYERLHILNILALQRRLSILEHHLDEIVGYEEDQANGRESLKPEKTSEALLAEIQDTVKAYDDAIISLALIQRNETPAKQIVDITKSYADANSLPSLFTELGINRGEVSNRENLLAIATTPRSWFSRFIATHPSLLALFQNKKQEAKGNTLMVKYTEAKLRNTEFGLVAGSLCVVQIIPIMALTLVTSKTVRFIMVLMLILIVSLINALFPKTAKATNFGAVAAYSAIIVVFISQSR